MTMLLLAVLALCSQVLGETSVTVYSEGFGLVREIREVELEKGVNRLPFIDVAARIDPTSVHFRSLTAPDKVELLEQNFEYDLVSPEKLLEKYIDQDITVRTEEGELSGKLLSSGQELVLEMPDGGVRVVRPEAIQTIVFPSLPQGLITRPTLVWEVECRKPGRHEVDVSYLTEGMGWHAEYVGVVGEKEGTMELSGWVSIDNRSGATYRDALLKLVAGRPRRIKKVPPGPPRVAMEIMERRPERPFEERAFFEYHLYTLGRRTTLKDRQTKQISLFPGTRVPVEKEYTYDALKDERHILVRLVFLNEKSSGLGFPLPAGKVRAYKRDRDGSLIFLGEDRIDHIPRDEKVEVAIGQAFDIVGERKVLEHKKIDDRAFEEQVQVVLRNHKEKKDITVQVVEHLWGDWEILKSTHDWERKDARTVVFPIWVPAKGRAELAYRVRYRW